MLPPLRRKINELLFCWEKKIQTVENMANFMYTHLSVLKIEGICLRGNFLGAL